MKEKLKHYIKEFILFVIAMTLFANVISLYKSQQLNDAPLSIQAVKLLNHEIYKIPHDRPILVHFWATWCPTCKLEAPNIEFLSKKFEVLTVAVNSGSDEEVQKFLTSHDYTYKVINDIQGRVTSNFKISAYPTTFIYDKNGKLLFSDVGYSSTFSMYLKMVWAGSK